MVAVNLWSLTPVKLSVCLLWLRSRRTVESRKADPHLRRGSCQDAALGKEQVQLLCEDSEEVTSSRTQCTGAKISIHVACSVFKTSLVLCCTKIKMYFFGLGRLSGCCISCWSHVPGLKTTGI